MLDFGLARAGALDGAEGSLPSLSHSPTLAAHGTAAGVILGTAAYMSPEQARGKSVDKRADIWAFGVIVWEMLTGRRLFAGDTVSDTLAAVLRADFEWKDLPALPPALDRLLRRCLARDPKARLHDIADARLEIADALAWKPEAPAAPVTAGAAPARRAWLPWALAAASALAAGGLGVVAYRHGSEEPRVVRFEVQPPPEAEFQLISNRPGVVAVSPDGRALAFTAASGGQTRLYVRSLDATEARALAGTEEAEFPFWSPDSRSLGFFAGDKLKRVEAAGGPPLTLCTVRQGKGGTWSPQGVIVFASDANSALSRVPQGGGEPAPVTKLDAARGDDSHRHPRFLPDGRHFLYLARNPGGGERGDNAVMVGSIDGGLDKLILRSAAAAEPAGGRLLFLRERTLMAQAFDAGRLELTGDAVPVAEDVRIVSPAAAQAVLAASADVLAYQQGEAGLERKLVWRDRAGKPVGTLGDLGRYLFQVALSPRGDAAAVAVQEQGTGAADVWTYETRRGVRSRFTFDPRVDASPVFSPDGETIFFESSRDAKPGLYRKPLGGAGAEELLLEAKSAIAPTDVSPDGRTLTFTWQGEKSSWDVWALPLEGERKPFPLVEGPRIECCGAFSPDGRFLAYSSDESGRYEVYVVPYPATGRRWQVSTQGGVWPRWRSDGREVLYQALDGTVSATAVTLAGSTLVPGPTEPLFKTRLAAGTEYVLYPAPDARRFLVVEAAEEEKRRPLVVVLGWQAALGR